MKTFYLLLITCIFSSNPVFCTSNPGYLSSDGVQLVTNLYLITPEGSPILVDGTLTQYNTNYSNDLNGMDARKMTNPGENWGMARNNAVYIIERRHIIEGSDSVFFKMWHMRKMNYRLELITNNLNFPGRTGILIDNYLNTSSPVELNGNTEINFSVNDDKESQATDRFRLIISNTKSSGLVPVEFLFSNAIKSNQSVEVIWKAENMTNNNIFSIQKSLDGIHFENASSVKVKDPTVNQYKFTDVSPLEGDNYYRISSSDKNGKINYSNVMKVNMTNELGNISLFPNPATAENLNLKISNQPAGEYTIRLMNSFGQAFLDKKITYNGGTLIEKIQPTQKVPAGIYRIEIISHDGKRKTISIVF